MASAACWYSRNALNRSISVDIRGPAVPLLPPPWIPITMSTPCRSPCDAPTTHGKRGLGPVLFVMRNYGRLRWKNLDQQAKLLYVYPLARAGLSPSLKWVPTNDNTTNRRCCVSPVQGAYGSYEIPDVSWCNSHSLEARVIQLPHGEGLLFSTSIWWDVAIGSRKGATVVSPRTAVFQRFSPVERARASTSGARSGRGRVARTHLP